MNEGANPSTESAHNRRARAGHPRPDIGEMVESLLAIVSVAIKKSNADRSDIDLIDAILKLASRVERIEDLMLKGRDKLGIGESRLRDGMITWDEAAKLMGKKSARAARETVWRERKKPGGLDVRVARGGVCKADFLKFIRDRYKRRQGRGKKIRNALAELDL